MIPKIYYQNPQTGELSDITNLTKSCVWKTERVGPAKLEVGLTDDASILNGGVVSFKTSKNVFYGYIFKCGTTESGEINFTAYDQIRYLKNKDTYVFRGKRADEIAKQIAEDFGLMTGEMSNTGYVIPLLIQDAKTLLDIISTALDHTIIHTRELYTLWDDFGRLRLSSPHDWVYDFVLGDESMVSRYTYNEDIDSATFNRIKLVRDNKDTGKRDVYIFQDANTMREWGTLQDYQTVEEGLNPLQIKEKGDRLLKLHNRSTRDFSFTAISDLSLRAGMGVFVDIEDLSKKGFYVVNSCSHDILKGTMDVKLMVV